MPRVTIHPTRTIVITVMPRVTIHPARAIVIPVRPGITVMPGVTIHPTRTHPTRTHSTRAIGIGVVLMGTGMRWQRPLRTGQLHWHVGD